MEDDKIKLGHWVIIQRQKYSKLFRFNSLTAQTALGKEQVQLKNINEQPYATTFKMIPTTVFGKKVIELEPCSDVGNLKETLNITGSGTDNRNLVIESDTQALTHEEIKLLRESGSSSSEIVGTIIENSKTFNTKTEYSQDKYLKKKEKKYFEWVDSAQV